MHLSEERERVKRLETRRVSDVSQLTSEMVAVSSVNYSSTDERFPGYTITGGNYKQNENVARHREEK